MVAGHAITQLPQPERQQVIMGLFSGDKNKGSSDSGETQKKLRQQKKKLALDQQINDLRMKQAELQGRGGGSDNFWGGPDTWFSSDWDP